MGITGDRPRAGAPQPARSFIICQCERARDLRSVYSFKYARWSSAKEDWQRSIGSGARGLQWNLVNIWGTPCLEFYGRLQFMAAHWAPKCLRANNGRECSSKAIRKLFRDEQVVQDVQWYSGEWSRRALKKFDCQYDSMYADLGSHVLRAINVDTRGFVNCVPHPGMKITWHLRRFTMVN